MAACGGGGTDDAGGGGASALANRHTQMGNRIAAMNPTTALPSSRDYTYTGVASMTVNRPAAAAIGVNNAAVRDRLTLLTDMTMQVHFGNTVGSSTMRGTGTNFEVQGHPNLAADGVLTVQNHPLSRGFGNSLDSHGMWNAQVDIYPTTNTSNVDRVVASGPFDSSLRGTGARAIQGIFNGAATVNNGTARSTTGTLWAER